MEAVGSSLLDSISKQLAHKLFSRPIAVMSLKPFIFLTAIVIFQFVLLSPIQAFDIPDTGQSKCYNEDGNILEPCPSEDEDYYGQDAQYTGSLQSYTKLDASGNSLAEDAASWAMARDNVTGLIWEIKTIGADSIHHNQNKYTWQEARDTFIPQLNEARFGGFDDWRLPTIKELSTLVNPNGANFRPGTNLPVAINVDYFPNTKRYPPYISANLDAQNPDYVWGITFSTGGVFWEDISDRYYVRAVRRNSTALGILIDNDDGTVTDTVTQQTWQQETIYYRTWKAALAYCENMTLNGHEDWRLPNRNELQTLIDYRTFDQAIDESKFPENSNGQYWTSTTDSHDPQIDTTHLAWTVGLSNGALNVASYKTNGLALRAVRGGTSGPSSLLVISNPIAGGAYEIGANLNIQWEPQDIGGNVSIELYREDTGGSWVTIIDATPNDGSYSWDVTGPISDNCAIRIIPTNAPSRSSVVGPFTLVTELDRPAANAGPDQTVFNNQTVTLDGSGSYVPTGSSVTSEWHQVEGPDVVLNNPTSLTTTFLSPFTNPSDLSFELTLTDGDGNTYTDQIAVQVRNELPIAEADAPASAYAGDEVTLDGSASVDNDDGIGAYAWVQTSGPRTVLSDPTAAVTTFDCPAKPNETLTFELTVTDISGNSKTTTVSILINNRKPVAEAGAYQEIDIDTTTEGTLIKLDGSLSQDPEGKALTYNWQQTSGPPVNIVGTQTASPAFNAPITGRNLVSLEFDLTVSDGIDEASDFVNVTVNFEVELIDLADETMHLSGSNGALDLVISGGKISSIPVLFAFESCEDWAASYRFSADDINWDGSSFFASHTWWSFYDDILQEGYTLTISGTVVSEGFITGQVKGRFHSTFLGTEDRACADPHTWNAYTSAMADDVDPPRLTLNGADPIQIYRNEAFNDPGVTAYDSLEGDLTDRIIIHNPVDMTTPGTYTITYDVTDSNGLSAAQLTRTVMVSIPTRSITTATKGDGAISLDPSGGTYEEGTVVTLAATPSDGFQFDHWEGDAYGSANPLTITVNEDLNITAVFTQVVAPPGQSTITTATQGNGTITLDPSGDAYDEGTEVTLTATPSNGYQFDHWEGDASGSANPLTITVNSDMNVTSVFTESSEGSKSSGGGGGSGGCFIFNLQ